ncbi:MAG: hypothetical protein GKR87_01425 [Kiritimatiellae bacterium]|nr:hypothetical protein [Kiritimatiellia bacterium]
MNQNQLLNYLAAIDKRLATETTLCIYGSAAFILLDEEGRTSLDIDIAAPYSEVDFEDFQQAAHAAGLPINPEENFSKDHIEWISIGRLCLSAPDAETSMVIFGKVKN